MIINETQLHHWVRSNERDAQGVIAELVARLAAASVRNPNDMRFPLGDSVGQSGEDGYLDTDVGFAPFIPDGRSFWEIGTGADAGSKATEDYNNRTKATQRVDREESVFVFVTPVSAVHGWNQPSQTKWRQNRIERKEWRDVRIIDGTRLIAWLGNFPSVQRWLATKIGVPADAVESPGERWTELSRIGSPPLLTPDLFLANRQAARTKLDEIFSGSSAWLKIDTHFPVQMADAVAAHIATLGEPLRREVEGRCLIVKTSEAWSELAALRDPHILIADFDVNDTETAGMRLLERAKIQKHSVVFAGMAGGPPHPNRVSIPDPTDYQVVEALKKAGYKEERARTLAQRSTGSLSSLLRCLQNPSSVPEWAQGTDAAELVIAAILGAWNEDLEGDRSVAEKISGKAYGEWIGKIREIAQRPGAPLKHRNGIWRFVPRYEGWYALAPRIFDDHLDRLKQIAIEVLQEQDPSLELAPAERYAASIRGKEWKHSHLLRNAITETVALLGSHSTALSSASFSRPEVTARITVREILDNADWQLWASLNDVLPLLAEAAPKEFLDAVENALGIEPCPFDGVFAQEGAGIAGRNYFTGLLWALETLAWDGGYLARVVLLLGELADRDPGGHWANRPANSLWTILLPWFPQTSAPLGKRKAAVTTLLSEFPEIGWDLLLNLLPQAQQNSSMTRKPAWRKMIPDDWSEGSTGRDYWDQINTYAMLAVETARQDAVKLSKVIGMASHLPPEALARLLVHLRSKGVSSLPEEQRLTLWTKLIDVVSRHRRFSAADWAMRSEVVDEISEIADSLSPSSAIHRHQRLFTDRDFDLYEENDNFEDQIKKLDERRQKAVSEVYAGRGVDAVLEFANLVKSPARVGIAFGGFGSFADDVAILPSSLESEATSLSQFAGGYVWAKFRRLKWEWVDSIDTSKWTVPEKAQFLAYLPFTPETWSRAAQLLKQEESLYWSKANANPFEAEEEMEVAIDRLLEVGRVRESIGCITRLVFQKRPVKAEQCIRALRVAAESYDAFRNIDTFEIVQIIKALQDNPDTDSSALAGIEWSFLPLLDSDYGTSPKLLDQRLADDPSFFCEVIRIIFRSTKKEASPEPLTEQHQPIATNAYRLLHRWQTPPGTQKDGSFDGAALNAWLAQVKTSCGESGHLKIALQRVGHVLRSSPPDPDGLWIHHSAAEVLNAKDATEIRKGFEVETYNSRGAYFVDPQGGPERELAKLYRKQAEEVEMRGYTRLATTVKEVAASYDREAEHNIIAAHLEDQSLAI